MNNPPFAHKVAEIFVKVDDFCVHFEKEFKQQALPCSITKKRNRPRFAILKSSRF